MTGDDVDAIWQVGVRIGLALSVVLFVLALSAFACGIATFLFMEVS